MSKNVLLISATTLKERTAAHKNMDEALIHPEIKLAQDEWIRTALGDKLMERLQDGIAAGDLSVEEQTLIDDYITDALIWFTMAGLPLVSGFQFFTKGVQSRTNEFSQNPSMSDMLQIAESYSDRGQFYRDRLIRYLRVNRADFPLYDCDNDDINPERSGYSVSLWLGDD